MSNTIKFRTTEGPPATEIPFEYDDIKNNMPPVLVEDVEGAVTYLLIVTVDLHILFFIYLQFSDCVVYMLIYQCLSSGS